MNTNKIAELKAKYAEMMSVDAKRADKAERIVLSNGVRDIGNGYYKVASESDPRKSHLVCLGEVNRCGCADYTERRLTACSHILAAVIYKDLPPEPQKDLWTAIQELSSANGLAPMKLGA